MSAPILVGMVYFAVLVVFTFLAGRGLLRIARCDPGGLSGLALAPVAIVVLWTVILGFFGACNIPIKWVSPPLWGLTALLALIGCCRPWPNLTDLLTLLTITWIVPLYVMLPYFTDQGLLETVVPAQLDGWVYLTGGWYIWEHGRAFTEGGSILLRVGSFYHDHRYMTFAMLAHLSMLDRPGDPLSILGLFQAWCLSMLIASAVLVYSAAAVSRPVSATLASLVGLGGMIQVTIYGSWFEQQLGLIYPTAIAGWIWLWPSTDNRRWWGLGLLLAAWTYTYPELTPVLLAGVVPLAWDRYREDQQPRLWRRGLAIAAIVACLVIVPAISSTIAFVSKQVYAASQVDSHGKGIFLGMLQWQFQPAAFWGLGEETRKRVSYPIGTATAIALTILVIAGVVTWLRQRRWGLAAALLIWLGGAIYLIVVREYPYAAFKVITLCWWLVIGAAAQGVAQLISGLSDGLRKRVTVAVGIAALWLFALNVGQGHVPFKIDTSPYDSMPIHEFRQLAHVPSLTQDGELMVSGKDDLAVQLAIYFLGEHSSHLATPKEWFTFPNIVRWAIDPRSMMSHPAKFIMGDQSRRTVTMNDLPVPTLQDVRYLLVERRDPIPVQQLSTRITSLGDFGPFHLWRIEPDDRPTAALALIHGDYPSAHVRREPLFDANFMTDDASLYIWSNQEGTVRFSGVAVSILGTGPSCLHIRTPDGSRSALVGTPSWRTPTPFEFTFPVTPGLNRLLLHAVLMGQVPEPFLLEAYPIMVTLQDGKLELTP